MDQFMDVRLNWLQNVYLILWWI